MTAAQIIQRVCVGVLFLGTNVVCQTMLKQHHSVLHAQISAVDSGDNNYNFFGSFYLASQGIGLSGIPIFSNIAILF